MSTAIEFAASAVQTDATACVAPCYAVSDGRYGALALMCLKLQAENTYATTAQHELQHWPSSVYHCTVHLKGNTA